MVMMMIQSLECLEKEKERERERENVCAMYFQSENEGERETFPPFSLSLSLITDEISIVNFDSLKESFSLSNLNSLFPSHQPL